MITEVELGSEGISYLRAYLSEGKALSKYLLTLPLEQGHTSSLLPPTVSIEASRQFELGGQVVSDADLTYEIGAGSYKMVGPLGVENDLRLASFISAYISRTGQRYAVLEHALAEPGDPWLSQRSVKFFTCNSAVYIFLSVQDTSLEMILTAVRAARAYRFTGILTNPLALPEISVGHEVTPGLLRVLAAATEHIIVGAYDGEGEVIWSRRP